MKKSLYIMLLASAMSIFVGSELSASQPKPLPRPPQKKPLPPTPTQPTQVEYPEEVTTLELPPTQVQYPEEVTTLELPPTQVQYPEEVTTLELPPAKLMANLSDFDKQKIAATESALKVQIAKMPTSPTRLRQLQNNEKQLAAILSDAYVVKSRFNKKTQNGLPRSDYIDKKLVDEFTTKLATLESYYPANATRSLAELEQEGYAVAEAGGWDQYRKAQQATSTTVMPPLPEIPAQTTQPMSAAEAAKREKRDARLERQRQKRNK